MTERNSILKTEGLDAGYGNQTILKDVPIDLYEGDILVIIGQNGSGKSTLLKTISGLLPKRSGSIWIKDRLERHLAPHHLVQKGVSFFIQGGLIIPQLTVHEHLELAAKTTNTHRLNTNLEYTFTELPRLKEIKKLKAGNLSGGERQMLSLGILIMQGTDLWLLDEPTAGLSPGNVEFTTTFLQRKNREGITILLVEHNMEVAFKLATHIAVAKDATITRKFNQSEFFEADFLDKIVYS